MTIVTDFVKPSRPGLDAAAEVLIPTDESDQDSLSHVNLKHDKSRSSHSSQFKKWTALCSLIIQTVAIVAATKYARRTPSPEASEEAVIRLQNGTLQMMAEPQYSTASTIAFSEAFKVAVSLAFLLLLKGRAETASVIKDVCIHNPMDSLRISIMAVCYVISNNLILFASDHLRLSVLLILSQTKIFMAAFFMKSILKKSLKGTQWLALLFLAIGVVSTEYFRRNPAKSATDDLGKVQKGDVMGVIAILLASAVSSFAGVYFEKILKATDNETGAQVVDRCVWLRNFQLSAISLPVAVLTWVRADHGQIAANGLFHGYNSALIWCLPIMHGMGGVTFSLVIKYADNILKGFAAAIAILLGVVTDVVLFGESVDMSFSVSASIVMIAVFLYSK